MKNICKKTWNGFVDSLGLITSPRIRRSNDGAAYGIVNPLGLTLSHNASVLLGSLFESDAPWSETETAAPDGNFAIFRADDERLEVLSDFAGSRTVWYYFDDDLS